MMTPVIGPPALQAAAAEAKAYLRVAGTNEDDLIERLVASAAALCEAFTGTWLMAREGAEVLPAAAAWRRLRATPVQAILGVDALSAAGAPSPLGAAAFATDIDARGDGWVRCLDAGAARRVRVRFNAGRAAEWGDLPEPLRQGIVRLAAHLFTNRDNARDDGPPAAVTALWRPYRRIRIG